MNAHTVHVVYIGCFILALLLGAIRGYAKQLTKRKRDEEREFLKWQRELETRASEIREREERLNRRK